jgi:hypothetical protein
MIEAFPIHLRLTWADGSRLLDVLDALGDRLHPELAQVARDLAFELHRGTTSRRQKQSEATRPDDRHPND